MKTKCIGVRSITYAQKAQEVLKRYGIKATAVKRAEANTGCGWCIRVAWSQSETAYTLLKNNGVRITGAIYDLS